MKSEMTGGLPSIHQTSKNQYSQKGIMTVLGSIATGETLDAGSSKGNILNHTAHSVSQYDFIRFTGGTYSGMEFQVISVPSVDTIKIDANLDPAPGADDYDILRPVTLTVGSDGTITVTQGSTQFDLDSVSTKVNKDTSTPANNIPLPVEILDTTGVVDIRTLLNAIVTDLAAIELINTDIETNTGNIDDKLGSLGQKASAGSAPVVLSTEQEAILQSLSNNQVLTPVDFLDSGIVDASSTAITTSGLEVVSSLAADVKEIEINDDIGDHMALTDGSDNIICYLSNTAISSRRKVSISAGTTLKIKSLTGASLTSGSITMNFLG